MHTMPQQTHDFLQHQLNTFARFAHVPFSNQSTVAIMLLENGTWVPGVRVESASYPLTIPALLNAYTTLMTVSRERIVAVIMNRNMRPEEVLLANSISASPLTMVTAYLLADITAALPEPDLQPLSPLLDLAPPATPADGIRIARNLLLRAFVPESDFAVGCVLVAGKDKLIPGVNVENSDWSRILCAERNALGTAVSYGYKNFETMYLTCAKDATCSPCGACRQLLAELTPKARLWMDRGTDPEQLSTPELLLPASFTGHALFNHS